MSDDKEFKKGVTHASINNDDDNSSKLGKGRDRPTSKRTMAAIVDGKGTVGRYVRLYSNGNTSDELNHYCEVEVFGTAREVIGRRGSASEVILIFERESWSVRSRAPAFLRTMKRPPMNDPRGRTTKHRTTQKGTFLIEYSEAVYPGFVSTVFLSCGSCVSWFPNCERPPWIPNFSLFIRRPHSACLFVMPLLRWLPLALSPSPRFGCALAISIGGRCMRTRRTRQ